MSTPSKKTIAAALAAFLATAGITGIAVTAGDDPEQPAPTHPAASSAAPAPSPEESPADDAEGPYEVIRVVDGDTVRLDIDGKDTALRLIGMDTPETVHPKMDVECYGPEASAEAKRLLTGQDVYITYDPTQDQKDHYGRHLVYLELENGTDFAEHMILEGFAEEYLYKKPYQRHDDYVVAENLAQEADLGLWAACD